MALFTDGPAITVDDLARADSGLLETAATLGINVTTKIELAHEAIAADLRIWLERTQGWRMEQVAVTPGLRTWEVMQALALVYRDAYFSDLAERYRARWDSYARESRDAYSRFVAEGLGVISDPMPRAVAPRLSQTAGSQAGGTFYASVAWVNASGQEGEASAVSSFEVQDGHLLVVSATKAPSRAVGFNVFAGTELNALTLQNDVPLPAAATFTYIPGATAHTRSPGTGQTVDFTKPLQRRLPRG